MKDAELDVIELLSQYLHGRRVMPTMETASLPPGVAGSYNPGSQELKLARGAGTSTLIHELSHAAQTAMEGQAIYDQPGGKFPAAFEKLFGLRGRYGEGARETANRLAPSGWQTRTSTGHLAGNCKLMDWESSSKEWAICVGKRLLMLTPPWPLSSCFC